MNKRFVLANLRLGEVYSFYADSNNKADFLSKLFCNHNDWELSDCVLRQIDKEDESI